MGDRQYQRKTVPQKNSLRGSALAEWQARRRMNTQNLSEEPLKHPLTKSEHKKRRWMVDPSTIPLSTHQVTGLPCAPQCIRYQDGCDDDGEYTAMDIDSDYEN